MDYLFKHLSSSFFFGTASDRYRGWQGQIYAREYGVTTRSKRVGEKTFKEETLEIRSVEEFFEHFDFVEIDYTFYQPLLDREGGALGSFHVLSEYGRFAGPGARFILKVPQEIVSRHTWQYDKHSRKREWKANPLSAQERGEIFAIQFYKPAIEILGERLVAFIFEYGYERRDSGMSPGGNMESMGALVERLPPDERYHVEERTDWLKTPDYYRFLRDHGLGNVFSHWTFLPSLREQYGKSNGFVSDRLAVVRLLTPRGVRYEEAYARYFPFTRLMDEDPRMIQDAAFLIGQGVEMAIPVFVAVNNRAGGNAPEIARRLVAELGAQGLLNSST